MLEQKLLKGKDPKGEHEHSYSYSYLHETI